MGIEIDGKTYQEVKIKKLVINGKEQHGQIISADAADNAQEISVTIYTQDSNTTEKLQEEQ
ncbi:hypothetical protein [Cellulosilyticum sp. I15G10I2]|uniref:hypothetical protein n=1 Tax=Cellulosilyticum sp. I15G10I2 TaxID=1892843 RepID=UPI00085C5580|nr:hypothetical protein [Cellulosilyticum sp. I15G10I2]